MYTSSIIPDSKSLVTYHPFPTEHEQITDSTDTINALVLLSALCVSMLSASFTTHLTHWSRNEIFDIGQTTFWNAFSWMDTSEFQTEFYFKCDGDGLAENEPALVQIIGWHRTRGKPLSEPMVIRLSHVCLNELNANYRTEFSFSLLILGTKYLIILGILNWRYLVNLTIDSWLTIMWYQS